MRHVVAYATCARHRLLGVALSEAAEEMVHEVMPSTGGTGGVIALDGQGNAVMTFNTAGMYRGVIRAGGEPHVEIYR
jgi:beta-aspartyl-peptidase (threonine type)